jgi:hypothetical protein
MEEVSQPSRWNTLRALRILNGAKNSFIKKNSEIQ